MAYELESEKDKLMKKTEKPMGAARKFIDNTLKRFSKIYAAAGHPNCVFEINFENLTKITSGKVIEVVE